MLRQGGDSAQALAGLILLVGFQIVVVTLPGRTHPSGPWCTCRRHAEDYEADVTDGPRDQRPQDTIPAAEQHSVRHPRYDGEVWRNGVSSKRTERAGRDVRCSCFVSWH